MTLESTILWLVIMAIVTAAIVFLLAAGGTSG
jgi:hypothetical protein